MIHVFLYYEHSTQQLHVKHLACFQQPETLFFITTHSSENDKSLLELQSANLTCMCEMKKEYSYIIIDLFLDDLLGVIALVLHWMKMMPSLLYMPLVL